MTVQVEQSGRLEWRWRVYDCEWPAAFSVEKAKGVCFTERGAERKGRKVAERIRREQQLRRETRRCINV